MVPNNRLLIIAMAASLLAGCTEMKRMTGQIDSTKLPGQREEILPPDQQQARDPAVTGQPLPQDPAAIHAPGVANGQVQPTPGAPAAPGAPQSPIVQNAVAAPSAPAVPAAPAMPAKGAGQEMITDTGKAGADCDPKVDLCPQVLKPDPLPPPSPLIPPKSKVADAKGAAAKTGTAKTADAKTAAAKKPVKKKKVVKKKPAEDPVPPEPKDDSPPPAPGGAPAPAPAPKGQ